MRRIRFFDTTLRDGEQSPGVNLNADEKLEIARQLARLGVDVIEAGFPVASPGDLQSVQQIAREVKGPIIAALAGQTGSTSNGRRKPLHRRNGAAFIRSSRRQTFI